MLTQRNLVGYVCLLSCCLALPAYARDGSHQGRIRHVLLISIDGMHAVDYLNCASGISGVNGGDPYCSALAALGQTGVNYLETSTSKPSDSFPGLMAIVSGGSPRTLGVFYDVDRPTKNALEQRWIDQTRTKLGTTNDREIMQRTFDRMK